MTVAVCESQGDVLKTLGQRPQAIQAYQQALDVLIEADRLERARLSRKLGDAWVEDRRYDVAWGCYTQAQAVLEANPMDRDIDWQREWPAGAPGADALALLGLPVGADGRHRHGDPGAHTGVRRLATAGRVLPPAGPESLSTGRNSGVAGIARLAASQALQAARQAGDVNAILTTQFSYGFQLLWSGELEPASRELSQALVSAQSTRNLLLETQCLTYLTILERRRGNLERVAVLAQHSLDAAQACQRADYIGVAQANQAWLAWRQGDLETAGRLGRPRWRPGTLAVMPIPSSGWASGRWWPSVWRRGRWLKRRYWRAGCSIPHSSACRQRWRRYWSKSARPAQGETGRRPGVLLEHALTLAQGQDYL